MTPRVFNSVMTESQNFAPSFSDVHIPRTSLIPDMLTPMAMVVRLVRDSPLIFDFHLQRVEIQNRIERIERTLLPQSNFINNGIGDC